MMAQQESAVSPSRNTVLVVEDEVGLRFVISTVLRDYGNFIVVEAQNGDEALIYLRSGGRADLMFTDVRMPGTIDGLALTRRVLQDFPNVKVMMTSGNLLQEERIRGVPVFVKPYDVDHVLEQMNVMLAVPSGEHS